jgi:peroxiredoxin
MNFKTALTLILVSLLLLGCQSPTDQQTPGPGDSPSESPASAGPGEPSPKFDLTAPDGSTVTFDPSVNPDNEVFLLLFWSFRWDPNVKTLLERTEELHERYAPRGLNIIAITYDEEPAALRNFLATHALPFEVAVGASSTYRNFKIESIPSGILVDTSGRIVRRWTGYYSTEELAEMISPHLPGRSGNSEG